MCDYEGGERGVIEKESPSDQTHSQSSVHSASINELRNDEDEPFGNVQKDKKVENSEKDTEEENLERYDQVKYFFQIIKDHND